MLMEKREKESRRIRDESRNSSPDRIYYLGQMRALSTTPSLVMVTRSQPRCQLVVEASQGTATDKQ